MLQTLVAMVKPGGTGRPGARHFGKPGALAAEHIFHRCRRRRPCRRRTNKHSCSFDSSFDASDELVTISEKSAMVENSASMVCSSVSRFRRTAGSGAFTRTLSKKRSTLGRSEAICSIWSGGRETVGRRGAWLRRPGRGRFRDRARAAWSLSGSPRPANSAWRQNIADAFEAGRERLEIRRGPRLSNRFEPFFHIEKIVPAGGEHGVDFVVLEAADLAEVIANAIGEKILQRRVAFAQRWIGSRSLPSTRILTMPCAARRSANGSFEPGRNQPDPEASAQGVELVGDGRQVAGDGARNRIFHADRLVMIVNRGRDFFRFALDARIKAADHALQFGEFLNQFGGEIGL